MRSLHHSVTPDFRQIAVFVPLLAFGLGAVVLSSNRSGTPVPVKSFPREDPAPAAKPELTAVPSAGSAATADWWSGKDDLRRGIERAKYFSKDAAGESVAEYETEEEFAAAVTNFVFKEFRSWARIYRNQTDTLARREMLGEGVVRAAIRRPHMARLMQSDPRAALQEALPLADYAALPPEVRAFVEEPFSTFGTVRVSEEEGGGVESGQ